MSTVNLPTPSTTQSSPASGPSNASRKPFDRRAMATALIAGLPDCRGCNNKAKRDCANQCCKTCCRLSGAPCASHELQEQVEASRKEDHSQDRQYQRVEHELTIPNNLIGRGLNGTVDRSLPCGHLVTVLIQNITYSGILFEEDTAVEMWKLPDGVSVTHEPVIIRTSMTQVGDTVIGSRLPDVGVHPGVSSNTDHMNVAVGSSMNEYSRQHNAAVKSAQVQSDDLSGDKSKRKYVKSGLYSKKRPKPTISSIEAGVPLNIPQVRKKKKKRPTKLPKGPRSAYIFFMSALRARMQMAPPEQHPLLVSQFDWNRISEADKEPYKVLAYADKQRYEREMLEYQSKLNAGNTQGDDDDDSGSDQEQDHGGDSDDKSDDDDQDHSMEMI